MLNTYIKNRGLTQTLVRNNNKNQINQINWDADYDGNTANISITSNADGNTKHFDVQLDNQDLASILNVPSISIPIDKRLKMDFVTSIFKQDPNIIKLELPDNTTYEKPLYHHEEIMPEKYSKNISYLSSPLPNEELIVPITINEKTIDKYTLTPKRHHKQKKTHKTHKTYKIYKKPKTALKTSKTKTKTKTALKTKCKCKTKTKTKTSKSSSNKFYLF
jgi:hypothetical protein